MAIQNRSTTLPEIWAKNAQTTIPTPPVAGITYRNQALNSTAIDKAWAYEEIVDSANFNQHAYLQDMLIKEAEQYGVMRWNNTTTYKEGGFCLAEDGNLYQAKRDNVNKEPTANSADWGKYPELSAYQLKSNLVQALSQATDKYPSAKAVQDAVNAKQATITGGATTIVSSNLTANRALMSNSSGKVAVSAVTSTELGYLDGVKSNIQAQIDGIDVTADIKAYISTVYPVGSLYFSTASTCPLQSLGIGTWNKVGTSLTLSVNTSVPVKGNGIVLGMTNGSTNFGIRNQGGSAYKSALTGYTGLYGGKVGDASSGTEINTTIGVGLTTDSSKSGIIGTVTRTQLTVNVFQRTA